MEKSNKWMVEIDGAKSSDAVLWNIVDLANHLKPQSIEFLCVFQELDLPNEIKSSFPDLQQTQLDNFGQDLSDNISKMLDDSIEFNITLNIGNPLTEILKKSQQLEVDLILVSNDKNFAKLHKKIIRKSPCSVLLIPDHKIDQISTILMPIDHSDYSVLSASVAEHFVQHYQIEKVKALHIYQDAGHYLNQVFESPYEVGELLQKRKELDEQLKSYAVFKTNEFVERYKFPGIEGEIIKLSKGANIDERLAKSRIKDKPDLIIMGAKGKTASSANLLGSVTESLEAELVQSFLYIVKKKGENVGFIRSLLGLN